MKPHITLKNTVRPIEDRPNDFRLSNFIAWHIKEDREAPLWEAQHELIIRAWLYREWIEPYLEPEEVEWVLKNPFPFLKAYRERTGDIEGVSQHIVDQLVEGLTMSGDPSDIDRHIERLVAFKREGFTEISLGLQEDPAESIKMIGEQYCRLSSDSDETDGLIDCILELLLRFEF